MNTSHVCGFILPRAISSERVAGPFRWRWCWKDWKIWAIVPPSCVQLRLLASSTCTRSAPRHPPQVSSQFTQVSIAERHLYPHIVDACHVYCNGGARVESMLLWLSAKAHLGISKRLALCRREDA
eukprot:8832858-Pyramimonas_sp.AAC.1